MPFSVKSGFPMGVRVSVKKRGLNSSWLVSRLLAASRCRSSSSCFNLVAWPNCLPRMASVTSDQKRRDSFGNCSSGGGTVLGTGIRGTRSIRSWGEDPFLARVK